MKKLKILLIDDDEEDYLIIRHYLLQGSYYRYDITWLANYSDALQALTENKHHIALLDYRLGRENGIVLLREAIAKGCDLPLIVLTGQGNEQVDQAALDAGAMDYMIKGKFDTASLERVLRYAISRKKSENELKQLSAQHKQLAEYDGLTGLANRRSFDKLLPQIIERNQRNNLSMALLFLDLNGFKQVNDEYGHDAGDEILRQVAARLEKALRRTDFIFRFAGDEFVVVVEGELNTEKLIRVSQKIITAIEQIFSIGKHRIKMGASVGIATSQRCGSEPKVLLKCADTAMYAAKQSTEQRFQFFTDDLNETAKQQFGDKDFLQQILSDGQLLLRYQPIMAVANETIIGIEASCYAMTHDGREIDSKALIAIASSCGLLAKLSHIFLQQAYMQSMPHLENTSLFLALDMGDVLWQQGELLAWTRELLQHSTLTAAQLQLECSESALMIDPERSTLLLREFESLGVHVVLDNMGMGHLVLGWLPLLSLFGIKIAANFMQDIDQKNSALVQAMLDLGRHLDYQVTILGIDSQQQYDFAKQCGAFAVQGCYSGEAVAIDDLTIYP